MAKNDYFIIVYYILRALYNSLKEGTEVSEDILFLRKYPADISDEYIIYIYENLQGEGYIRGAEIVEINRLGTKEKGAFIRSLKNVSITPKGIEYLEDNSMMKKALDVIKTYTDIAFRIIK